jgi:tetratricopeptide (TPR) repeat protein
MTGAFGVYALLRIHALGGMAPAQGTYYKLHGETLILSIIATLGQHLGALIAPVHLNFFHFFEATTTVTPLVIVAFVVELGLIAGIFLSRSRPISYGLFFLLMPLLPALNINGVGENVVAERYLYLPSVGFVLVIAAAWEWLAARQRETAWAFVVLIAVASVWILAPRNLDWHDDERLLKVSAASSPKAGSLVSDLGSLYYHRGEYNAAIAEYEAALQLQPDRAIIHSNLGGALARLGRYQDAATELRKAIALDPRSAEAHMSLGLALEALGDVPGAVAENEKALEIRPDYAEACVDLAVIRIRQKDYPAAIDLLQRAITMDPRNFEAHFNLGVADNYSHRYTEASQAFRKAIEVAPQHPSVYLAHYHLGVSYAHLDSAEAAAMEFSAALQLKPDFGPAQDGLAQARSRLRE